MVISTLREEHYYVWFSNFGDRPQHNFSEGEIFSTGIIARVWRTFMCEESGEFCVEKIVQIDNFGE